jgi:hypothetical protein
MGVPAKQNLHNPDWYPCGFSQGIAVQSGNPGKTGNN